MNLYAGASGGLRFTDIVCSGKIVQIDSGEDASRRACLFEVWFRFRRLHWGAFVVRIVFLGTPEFGVPILEALEQHHEVLAVVTQPDRPVGRGRKRVEAPPVKRAAESLGIEVLQPERLGRDKAVLQRLRNLDADVFVLAAYGQILRSKVLDIPPHGVIGVHASLLPRWRGAAPVAAAILHGDERTGVSLMLTDEGMDTGPVIASRSLPIERDDTTETLTAKLAEVGADLLIETLPACVRGEIAPRPQDDTAATRAPLLTKEQGRLDWIQPALALDRQVRAFHPWPGAHTTWQGQSLKVVVARAIDAATEGTPGTVMIWDRQVCVVAGEGLLRLDSLQMAGRKVMDAQTFVRGQRGFVGSVLGL